MQNTPALSALQTKGQQDDSTMNLKTTLSQSSGNQSSEVNVVQEPSTADESILQMITPLTDSRMSFSEFLQNAQEAVSLPFTTERITALNEIGQAIRQDPLLRQDGASVALSFWLRKANIQIMCKQFTERFAGSQTDNSQLVIVPAGVVFHLAPANVDTLFVYSWALAFLCGNTNIVRISSQENLVVERLLACINLVMQTNSLLQDSNSFITYAHDDDVTGLISAKCTHRVIWGGNETVAKIRSIPLNPHASERVFSSKFSYSVINSTAFCRAVTNSDESSSDITTSARSAISTAIYNDIFWFNQKACSSPHIVFWLGTKNECKVAQSTYSTLLKSEMLRRHHNNTVSDSVYRLNHAFDAAASRSLQVEIASEGFVTLHAQNSNEPRRNEYGNGILEHVNVDSIDVVTAWAKQQDQTITYFGLTKEDLTTLAQTAGCNGVDRIVPLGQALDFSPTWDGFDLISDFTRHVTVVH